MPQEDQNIKLAILRALLKLLETTSSGTNSTEQFVVMNMTEFIFNAENRGKLRKLFRRYEDFFESDAKDLKDVAAEFVKIQGVHANASATHLAPKHKTQKTKLGAVFHF